jgi:hypothetical protein
LDNNLTTRESIAQKIHRLNRAAPLTTYLKRRRRGRVNLISMEGNGYELRASQILRLDRSDHVSGTSAAKPANNYKSPRHRSGNVDGGGGDVRTEGGGCY